MQSQGHSPRTPSAADRLQIKANALQADVDRARGELEESRRIRAILVKSKTEEIALLQGRIEGEKGESSRSATRRPH